MGKCQRRSLTVLMPSFLNLGRFLGPTLFSCSMERERSIMLGVGSLYRPRGFPKIFLPVSLLPRGIFGIRAGDMKGNSVRGYFNIVSSILKAGNLPFPKVSPR